MLTLVRRSDIINRSELGLQLDANPIAGASPVTGFVRAVWAHYHQRDAELAVTLDGLPGARFAATGAQPTAMRRFLLRAPTSASAKPSASGCASTANSRPTQAVPAEPLNLVSACKRDR